MFVSRADCVSVAERTRSNGAATNVVVVVTPVALLGVVAVETEPEPQTGAGNVLYAFRAKWVASPGSISTSLLSASIPSAASVAPYAEVCWVFVDSPAPSGGDCSLWRWES